MFHYFSDKVKNLLSQEIERAINKSFKSGLMKSVAAQNISQENSTDVVINDYVYAPRYRTPLEKSCFDNVFDNVNREAIAEKILAMCKYKEALNRIPADSDGDEVSPFWNNDWISPLDALSVYTFIAEKKPRYYVECGSGNTTKFAYRSIKDNNLKTKIISIDPNPRAEIDRICDQVLRIPFEAMDTRFFSDLTQDDIFLVDNSHRSFPNSDVTVFFSEVLPKLPDNMLFAMHDIFLPYDYPELWNKEKRFYNEQYLLLSYLLGGAMGDEIYFPCSFVGYDAEFSRLINECFNACEDFTIPRVKEGCFFWMKKNNPNRP